MRQTTINEVLRIPISYAIRDLMGKEIDSRIIEAARVHFMTTGETLIDTAKHFGLSLPTLRSHAQKGKWNSARSKIKGTLENCDQLVSQRSIEKISQGIQEKASERVNSHLERVFSTGSKFMEKLEANMLGAMSLPPILDAQTALSTIKSYQTADGLVRRSLGLSDQVEVVVSGQVDHSHTLQVLQSCRALVDSGKAQDVVVDVQALLDEAKGEGK